VSPDDKTIRCLDCGEEFVFTAGEQAFYREHGLTNTPTRCRKCREARKTNKPAAPPRARREAAGAPREARQTYAAVCAECGAVTEIPFPPSAGRPAYCRDCFANRRRGGSPGGNGSLRFHPRPESASGDGTATTSAMDGRQQGEVKWFNTTKGFGFIQSAEGGEVFVHFSAITGDGYRTLTGGDRVEFDVLQGDKGRQAANVTKV
jgi:CxxC-x17-CxxC domain-containing protein